MLAWVAKWQRRSPCSTVCVTSTRIEYQNTHPWSGPSPKISYTYKAEFIKGTKSKVSQELFVKYPQLVCDVCRVLCCLPVADHAATHAARYSRHSWNQDRGDPNWAAGFIRHGRGVWLRPVLGAS